mgnify:CR=1 FL=1
MLVLNNRFIRFLLIGVIAINLFSACTKPAPQLPANKVHNTDSTATVLMEMNKIIAHQEDSLISRYVADSCQGFTKQEQGFWMKKIQNTGNRKFALKDVCAVNIKIMHLNGQYIDEIAQRITIGKMEIFSGLDDALMQMREGETAEFIFPWYLAYGMNGRGDKIKPYTSLRVSVVAK